MVRPSIGVWEKDTLVIDTVTFNAQLAPAGDELMEHFCQETNQFGVAGGLTHPFARPWSGEKVANHGEHDGHESS